MAVSHALTSNIAGLTPTPTPWTPPSDWLALPTVNDGDQKLVGLFAVWPGSNPVGLTCQGAFTVDWGDGTAPTNYASGATATYNYTWANISAATTTSEGNRQAIITVTPQAGQTLTVISLTPIPTGVPATYSPQWRDITVAGHQIATCYFNSAGSSMRNAVRRVTMVGATSISNATNMFSLCYALRSVVGTAWSNNVTSFNSTFVSCLALQTIPLLNTALCSDFTSMFAGCVSLQTIPLINTSAGINFTTMFNGCSSLQSIPLLSTGAATTFGSMFINCVSLTTIPLLNTGAVTNFASMFSGCSSLITIPLINTAAATNFNSMFVNCAALSSMPLLNTGAGTNFGNMFQGCGALNTVPLFNTANAVTVSSMFQYCTAMQSLPGFNFALPTSFASVVGNTSTITSAPFSGVRFSISFSSQQMNAAALNALYNAIGTASGAQTLTVSGNPGYAASTTSIATGKGWTVN